MEHWKEVKAFLNTRREDREGLEVSEEAIMILHCIAREA